MFYSDKSWTILGGITSLCQSFYYLLVLQMPEMKIPEFTNSVDIDEVAHNEPPHLDYTVCPLVFELSIRCTLDLEFFENLQA